MTTGAWATSRSLSRWEELDLGPVSIPFVAAGSQRWTGQIEIMSTTGAIGYVALDYLALVPTSDGYGKARASFSYSPGVATGYDSFIATTSGATLNGRVAPSGGTWATSGDAPDFVFYDYFNTVANDRVESIDRVNSGPETTGRFAILGATNYADTQVDVSVWMGNNAEAAVIARWTNSNNYLRLRVPYAQTFGGAETVYLESVVAGTVTVIAQGTWNRTFQAVYRFKLIAYVSGRVIGQILSAAGSVIAQLEATSSAVATGGTLATGKPGIWDRVPAGGVGGRNYTDFIVGTPAAEPIALYSGRNMQIRHDDAIREDSTGTYVGRPPSYRGSRFLIPVGKSRVLVKARRNDIEAASDDNVTDSLQIQIAWTPRGLAVPR